MRKSLVWLSLLVVMLSLAAPVWAVEAGGIDEEKPLNIGRLVVIAEQVKGWDNIAANRVKGYDPAKLAVGESIPVYYYTNSGFEQRYIFYPILFEEQYFMLVGETDGRIWSNDEIDRWLDKVEVKVDCPLAIVWDNACAYLYDGSQWQLLHRYVDIHVRKSDLPEMDVEKVSGEGLELRAMNQRFTPLVDAYYGRLSLEQQAEVEEFRQEMAAIQEQKEEEERALAAKQAAIDQAAWQQELRARGYVPVYLDEKFQYNVCCMLNGKAMVALWDISDVTGDRRKFESRKYEFRNNRVLLYSEEQEYWLDRQTGQLQSGGRTLGQVLVKKSDGIEWVELRKLAELFGMQVRWDAINRQINISSK